MHSAFIAELVAESLNCDGEFGNGRREEQIAVIGLGLDLLTRNLRGGVLVAGGLAGGRGGLGRRRGLHGCRCWASWGRAEWREVQLGMVPAELVSILAETGAGATLAAGWRPVETG